MIPVFILTYRGIDYFNEWFDPTNYSDEVQFYIVDNGGQTIPQNLWYLHEFTTSRNVGCAGGLNLMSRIAFEHMELDAMIIGQDDGKFTQSMLEQIWENISPDTFVGGYNRSFEFALFGLHSTLYYDVGPFDENFIFGGCEDNDYKHRMKLAGKKLLPMDFDANLNCSLSAQVEGDMLRKTGVYNAAYIGMKWGTNYEYTHPFNDPSLHKDNIPVQQGIRDVYGEVDKYPSDSEFESLVEEEL